MNIYDFVENVAGWATVRGIYEQSTEKKQIEKFCEELSEYLNAESDEERMDAIGDMAVCLVNASIIGSGKFLTNRFYFHSSTADSNHFLAFLYLKSYECATASLACLAGRHGFIFSDCLSMAWNEIKDRKGMMIDGMFVKWDNLDNSQRKKLENRMKLKS